MARRHLVDGDLGALASVYVSAKLHLSTARTRIVNYAQWRSRADFEAMPRDPCARAHIANTGKFDPVIFELRYSDWAEATR